MADSTRVLLKLSPGAGLAAVHPEVNLRPLYDTAPALGLTGAPAWYLADLPDGGPTPWDAAHTQAAAQLGLAPGDVLAIEPDLPQTLFRDTTDWEAGPGLAAADCSAPQKQTSQGGRVVVADDGWHLRDEYSQLGSARAQVTFTPPRTRIGHIDTGYDRDHVGCPKNILRNLERNFVRADDQPGSAEDPDFMGILDNSGHGTGTIGILAAGAIPQLGNLVLGGAPDADILPLRISNRVVLFYTSAFAQALKYAIGQQCDVISLSMGGLPSSTWNEAINEAYEAGICIVAAAGNNFVNLPTRHVVYPARYHRVLAACGVMGNYQPYYHLTAMQGNFGPQSIMDAALAAYTPNIPWPKFGCKDIVRLNGEGTSAATPQIAAAAALYYEKYKSALPRDWRRVEAVRHALFSTAKSGSETYFGQGLLQAKAALAVLPNLNLKKTPSDRDSFAFFRVLSGLGIVDVPLREKMFHLELTQRWLLNPDLQAIVPEPDLKVPEKNLRAFLEAAISDDQTSRALRKYLLERYSQLFGAPGPTPPPPTAVTPRPAFQMDIKVSDPPHRRLRAYAMDPSFAARYETAPLSEAVLKVRWEALEPGPKGEYLEVIDTDLGDGQSSTTYAPVDLNHPFLLARDGWPASEGNPAFHQQMVYAVAMKTIEHFERALGRPVLWRPLPDSAEGAHDGAYVPRLRLYPHAFHQANAYYSPRQKALLFGYFEAKADDPDYHIPGQRIYTCLSHDIVAHETTHAILDGMHSRFNEASNPDSLAFHEAFADIVSLMQHFTIQEILEHEITKTRGNLETESILGSLAVQFGRAAGQRGALRNAIGAINAQGVWTRLQPNPEDYQKIVAPHSRGALLVAAVFDAFLTIYQNRTADLLRLSTGGTGVLPTGAIHPDLVRRLAHEAAKAAGHILNMCIRALDYLPPMDITFYEYLRAIITADIDLVGDDPLNYRIAFIEAFRKRGIYALSSDPQSLDTLSVDTLRWQGIDLANTSRVITAQFRRIVQHLKRYADACFYVGNRETLFKQTQKYRRELEQAIAKNLEAMPDAEARQFAELFGLSPDLSIKVHELRRSIRIGPRGNHIPQIIVALIQDRPIQVSGSGAPQQIRFGGGSTLIVDLSQPAVQYAIFKNIGSTTREARTRSFVEFALQEPQGELLFQSQAEPFAALHDINELG